MVLEDRVRRPKLLPFVEKDRGIMVIPITSSLAADVMIQGRRGETIIHPVENRKSLVEIILEETVAEVPQEEEMIVVLMIPDMMILRQVIEAARKEEIKEKQS